ncbi:unnamed protein product [Plutella xylostella]|uniref:(diamondback moth) hypothetical protein n=1 Tax=Plutella xylostella TaxID=51655 RepID=A0A8S4FIJ8_PLUXY|nr:unnamed protein product [Plutella xylostella]
MAMLQSRLATLKSVLDQRTVEYENQLLVLRSVGLVRVEMLPEKSSPAEASTASPEATTTTSEATNSIPLATTELTTGLPRATTRLLAATTSIPLATTGLTTGLSGTTTGLSGTTTILPRANTRLLAATTSLPTAAPSSEVIQSGSAAADVFQASTKKLHRKPTYSQAASRIVGNKQLPKMSPTTLTRLTTSSSNSSEDYSTVVYSDRLGKDFGHMLGLKNDLEHSLSKRSIHSEVILENIQEAFDAQLYSRRKRSIRQELFWTGFQTLEDINAWIQYMTETHPRVVSTVVAGKSYEGRNITGIKISRGSGRQAFVLEGGSIASDWVSPVILTYIANQLITGEDNEAKKASEDFDWYIFPILNPDGYEYTQDEVRLWRKNRAPTTGRNIGTDLTKNWNSHWGASGGSHTPSAANFVGLGPFSEPETRQFSDYLLNINQAMAGFLSFGSFGQKLVIPFAHTDDALYNFNDMVTIGRRAMGSLAVKYGTMYQVGNSRAVSDGSTGAMADWVKYRFNPPIAASFLLRDSGVPPAILPAREVLPSCEETFDALMAILREARFIDVL